MRRLLALAVLAGLVGVGSLYACGHWIAGTLALCACGYAVTTQDPHHDGRRGEEDARNVD